MALDPPSRMRRYARLVTCVLAAACADPRAPAPNGDSATPGDPAATSEAPAGYLITPTSMGGIALGATLGDIRRALPVAQFERASDGEGAALISLTLAPGASLILWAEEDDADAEIDWSKQVRLIETTSPAFATPEGVRAGARVAEVVQQYGPVREVIESEIESRQYITFERQPAHLTLRLDYSGIFAEGERTTKVVAPSGAIHSIAIAAAPSPAPGP